jgi:hypothetical protein
MLLFKQQQAARFFYSNKLSSFSFSFSKWCFNELINQSSRQQQQQAFVLKWVRHFVEHLEEYKRHLKLTRHHSPSPRSPSTTNLRPRLPPKSRSRPQYPPN